MGASLAGMVVLRTSWLAVVVSVGGWSVLGAAALDVDAARRLMTTVTDVLIDRQSLGSWSDCGVLCLLAAALIGLLSVLLSSHALSRVVLSELHSATDVSRLSTTLAQSDTLSVCLEDWLDGTSGVARPAHRGDGGCGGSVMREEAVVVVTERRAVTLRPP